MKFRNILTNETVIKPNKVEAINYFKEKDDKITQVHIKPVVILNDEKPAKAKELSFTNKTESDGKENKRNT